MGRTFNFRTRCRYTLPRAGWFRASARLHHGDVLRLGGNRDGRPGGGLQEHVYRVDAPALGARWGGTVVAAAPAVTNLARGLHVLRVGDQDADARYKVYDFTLTSSLTLLNLLADSRLLTPGSLGHATCHTRLHTKTGINVIRRLTSHHIVASRHHRTSRTISSARPHHHRLHSSTPLALAARCRPRRRAHPAAALTPAAPSPR